ncbi:MAG: hypothetical protein JXR44_05070 [Thiotrichales bacterium]|nr:hypothetical protein [Thiotrichales bacterium]
MSEQTYSLGAKEVQETILMLNLAVAQIDLSITEGDHSVNTLIDSFSFMAQQLQQIQSTGHALLEQANHENREDAQQLLSQAGELSAKIQQAIIAFQFYDKLSQRLAHVSNGLSGLAEIVAHQMQVKSPQAWQDFKMSVRKGTTMREEEELFTLIFDQGVATTDAIELIKQRMRQRLNDSVPEETEIELF